jgi:hypothetical protein
MRKLETANDIEKALAGLMPVALSGRACDEIEDMLDELAGDAQFVEFKSAKLGKWAVVGGAAAAVALVLVVISSGSAAKKAVSVSSLEQLADDAPELVFITESDRVEGVRDEGLFVDAGGSAIRKVRVRVIEKRQMRDEETGIIVMLTEPREEMYMVPVSTF